MFLGQVIEPTNLSLNNKPVCSAGSEATENTEIPSGKGVVFLH